MGKKIPVWQCLLVMVVMIAALMWSIIVDDGGEPHIALIIAASFAAIIGVARFHQQIHAGYLNPCYRRCYDLFMACSRNNSFHDVLRYQSYQP